MTALETLLALDPCQKASASVSILLGLAESQTGEAYGSNRNTAVALLALHWLALRARGSHGAAGQITGESEGDLSRTYASPTMQSNIALGQTSWGLELLRLRKMSFVSGMKTRMDYLGSC